MFNHDCKTTITYWVFCSYFFNSTYSAFHFRYLFIFFPSILIVINSGFILFFFCFLDLFLFPLASEKNTSPIVFTVEELWQKKDSYVGDRIAVEGFYYISNDGPSLVQATTVSNPNPTIWIILDETSLNSAKQAADITLISNLEYHVVGVLQEIPFPVGSGFKFIVESIDAV